MNRHQRLVADLVSDHGCQAGRGFSAQLRAIESDEMEDDREFLSGPWPIPDAWKIDNDAHLLTVYEVEDTHPMNDQKMTEWSTLWHFMDTYDWEMRLVHVSRWGQMTDVTLPAVYREFHLRPTDHANRHEAPDAP